MSLATTATPAAGAGSLKRLASRAPWTGHGKHMRFYNLVIRDSSSGKIQLQFTSYPSGFPGGMTGPPLPGANTSGPSLFGVSPAGFGIPGFTTPYDPGALAVHFDCYVTPAALGDNPGGSIVVVEGIDPKFLSNA